MSMSRASGRAVITSNYLPAAAGHVLLTYGSLAASETGLLKIGLKTYGEFLVKEINFLQTLNFNLILTLFHQTIYPSSNNIFRFNFINSTSTFLYLQIILNQD